MTTVTRQIQFKTKARRKTMVPNAASPHELKRPVARIPRVSKLMALAIRFDQLLRDGEVADQSELSRLLHITQPRMTQIMNLLHLAPDIQEELLFLPPIDLGKDLITERNLRTITRFHDWSVQSATWRTLCPLLRKHTDGQLISPLPKSGHCP